MEASPSAAYRPYHSDEEEDEDETYVLLMLHPSGLMASGMVSDELATADNRPGMFEATYPQVLSPYISKEEWEDIIKNVDGLWYPVVDKEESKNSQVCCLCCLCCLTCGLSLLCTCCYVSYLNSDIKNEMLRARSHIKQYFETDLNPRWLSPSMFLCLLSLSLATLCCFLYAAHNIRFSFSPTVERVYIKISYRADGDRARSGHERSASSSTTSTSYFTSEASTLRPTNTTSTLEEEEEEELGEEASLLGRNRHSPKVTSYQESAMLGGID
ncbi:hypothetical protein QOT17_004999 [Balamuthia mandrillaris]